MALRNFFDSWRSFTLVFVLLLALTALSMRLVRASQPLAVGATINVNTTDDELNNDGDCSLREAVRSANLDGMVDNCTPGSGLDLIMIPPGSYVLSIAGSGEDVSLTGDLDITDDVTIEGSGSAVTIIDGGGIDRVFHVQSGVEVQFNNLAIVGGLETPLGGGGLAANPGSRVRINESLIADNSSPSAGGILNGGSMTLTLTTVSTNTATVNTGGGIVNSAGASTTLISSTLHFNKGVGGGGISTFNGEISIVDSTISDNEDTSVSSSGGGIRTGGILANLNVINSTISGNNSTFSGGGIFALSGATVYLANATVSGNSAGTNGGGLEGSGGTVTMHNSILADNTAGNNPDCSAAINSLGYNLIEVDGPSCTINGNMTGVVTGQDPLLGPLQNNGGPTSTQALLNGSLAIEGGNPTGCTDPDGQPLTADQRGVERPSGPVCDIGAYEEPAVPADDEKVFLPVVLAP